jgi:hypothetical protein
MQNQASRDIYRDRHNAADGNPDSKSSERMQNDVQRNLNQEQRIEQGGDSGTLTNREVGSLEAGQANVDHKEGVAARDGHVGAGEQANVQRSENHQSRRIHHPAIPAGSAFLDVSTPGRPVSGTGSSLVLLLAGSSRG